MSTATGVPAAAEAGRRGPASWPRRLAGWPPWAVTVLAGLVFLMVRQRPSAPDRQVRENLPPAVPSSAPPCVLPEAGQKAPPSEAPTRGAIS